jgi:D-glycero-D-manno-heptose 1,7-bisphosphate phosphatase
MVSAAAPTRHERSVFLDRDGVLVVPEFRDGRSFAPISLEQFAVYPEAAACLARLKAAGFQLIVVTNQPDVGAGKVSCETVTQMHAELAAKLPIDDIKVCFHTRDQRCTCRKPLPGMLIEAAAERAIDLPASIMVGDRASDIDAGQAAGCRTAFIDHGYAAELKPQSADFVGSSLSEVTEWILSAEKARAR